MTAMPDDVVGAGVSAEQTVTIVTARVGGRAQSNPSACANSPNLDPSDHAVIESSADRRCLESATAMNELLKFEPLPLPDVNNLEFVPPLPTWVEKRIAAVSRTYAMNAAGRYCNGPWLSLELLPTSSQRAAIERHVDALCALMEQTPERDRGSERATFALIAKLLQALPNPKTSASANGARGEAFMVALEADPHWAVAAAVRGWYRGKCGKQHDYRWQPAPAVLHDLARREAWKIRGRIQQLEDVLNAEAPLTFSDEHRERMLKRLAKEIPVVLGTHTSANAPRLLR